MIALISVLLGVGRAAAQERGGLFGNLFKAFTETAETKTAGAAKSSKSLDAEFHYDFQQGRWDRRLLPPIGESKALAATPQGLRLALPANTHSEANLTGVRPRFRIRGDFEWTLAYELGTMAKPTEGDGAGLGVRIVLDTPAKEEAQLARIRHPKHGEAYAVTFATVGSDKKLNKQTRHFPSKANRGRLRLVRRGTSLIFLAAEADSGEFRELYQTVLGSADIAALEILVPSGKPAAAVEAWVTTVELRAEALPGLGTTVATMHEERLYADPVAVREGAVVFETDPPRTIPLDEIVSMVFAADGTAKGASVTTSTSATAAKPANAKKGAANPATNAGAARLAASVWLDGGDLIHGTLLALGRERLRLQPAWSEPIDVPLIHVQGMAFGTDAAQRERIRQELRRPGALDSAWVVAADQSMTKVTGTVEELAQGRLKFTYEGAARTITATRLAGLVLAARPLQRPPTVPYPTFLTANNSILSGKLVAFDKASIAVETFWGTTIRLQRHGLRQATFKNGKLVYLSDLEPTAVEETPYFSRTFPYRRDLGLAGEKALVKGRTPTKYLAVHSRSVLHYALDGKYAAFRTRVAFDDAAGGLGRVALRVLADGKPLVEKADFKATDEPLDLDLNVAGVQQLSLEVDFGEDEDIGDRVVWSDARLFRVANVGPARSR